MTKEYIHYGRDSFDKELLKNADKYRYCYGRDFPDLRAEVCIKPNGLWASPIDCSLISWREWCENENFCLSELDYSFKFTLTEKANVLMIRRLRDARKYMISDMCLNLDKIYREFDAMEISYGSDFLAFRENYCFNTWDCDSICVWNPDIIIPS